MRESIGATWIINIILFFIVVIISYLGISINYTRAFRVKNHIINVLEEYGNWQEAQTVLATQGVDGETFWSRTGYDKNKITVKQAASSGAIGFARACKFYVSVPLDITIPVVNVPLAIEVTGETRSIYNGSGACGV